MSERLRITVSVTKETKAIFESMAEASGLSLGKCIGDWLEDTSEGAQFVAQKMEQARTAPKLVMREFQAMANGIAQDVNSAAEILRKAKFPKASPGDPLGVKAARVEVEPPSSPTGVKSLKTIKDRGVKSLKRTRDQGGLL